MSNTVKGISTAKGYHEKIPFAECADTVKMLTLKKLGMYTDTASCDVEESGLYIISISHTHGIVQAFMLIDKTIAENITVEVKYLLYEGIVNYSGKLTNGVISFAKDTNDTSSPYISSIRYIPFQ